ncbi:MerR family transcriptional regulator [Candidatus Woesearchaeota archaeon]|nr:MerR family transcriptional regulator [Candidatus Woesearchaeota archaeon]
MKSFFTPKEVKRIVGISYRQMQYWDNSNFISPSYRRRNKYRLYTFTDLTKLKFAKQLREKGYSIQRLRKTVKSLEDLLPKVSHPLVELTFLIDGDRILVFDGDVLMNDTNKSYLRFNVKSLREKINEICKDEFSPKSKENNRSEAASKWEKKSSGIYELYYSHWYQKLQEDSIKGDIHKAY